MNYQSLLKESARSQPVYEPGKPVEIVAREFGLDPSAIVKLASNENPLGPSPKALEAVSRCLSGSALYPENSGWFLRRALADLHELDATQFTFGAGSNQLFYMLGDLFLEPGREVVMGRHAFISMKLVTLLHGAQPIEVPLRADFRHDFPAMLAAITENTRLVYVPDPNNPTGTACAADDVVSFARSLPPQVVLVYDEAYAEYREKSPDLRPLIAEGRKILVTRTFSKIHGLAGLRIGYGYSDPELAAWLDRVRPPFNISTAAMEGARAALSDDDWIRRSREVNRSGYEQLSQGLAELGLAFLPSEGNFILVQVGEAAMVFDQLQRRGVITRPVGVYGFREHLRVSIGTSPQNARLLRALKEVLGG